MYGLIVALAVKLGLTPFTVYEDVRCPETDGDGVIVCAEDGSVHPENQQCDLYCVSFD
jgi:hypothetical protein